MRIPDLATLRSSKVYQTLASLAKMPVFRQMRFLEVFNKIWDLATARGATPDVADTNASAIAIMAAERYTPTPAMASLEDEEHYFATMTEFQYSRGGQVEINDFSLVLSNMDLINAAIAGDAFNLEHDHTQPTGAIRRIATREQVPPEIRVKYPDAPFFTVASYYKDTPDAIRELKTVSAEWTQLKAAPDGSRKVFIPQTFALTTDPATPEVLGVGKAAALEAEKRAAGGFAKSFEEEIALGGSRDTMPLTTEELQTKVASLQKEVDASKESASKIKDIEQKFAALEKTHNEFVVKVASLTGQAPKGDEKPSEDKALSGLQTKMASMEQDLQAIKAEAAQKEATAWADSIVKTKEIAMDAKPKLASLYLTAKQSALDLTAHLPVKVLKPGQSSANLEVEQVDEKKAAETEAFLKEAFPK